VGLWVCVWVCAHQLLSNGTPFFHPKIKYHAPLLLSKRFPEVLVHNTSNLFFNLASLLSQKIF
jgi:hypothetical protein